MSFNSFLNNNISLQHINYGRDNSAIKVGLNIDCFSINFLFLLTRGFPLIFCEMCSLACTHLKRNPFTFSIFLQGRDGSLTQVCKTVQRAVGRPEGSDTRSPGHSKDASVGVYV